MAIVVIGVNHRTVPLELFERLTVDAEHLPKALANVSRRDHVAEAVVLSTCNRTEIYAEVDRFHDAYADLRGFLAENANVAPADIADHLYLHHDESAVQHLFSVAAGLDSVVVGESEILRQIKTAWDAARTESVSGPILNTVFRHALEVGKRARTETSIARHIASASTAAVAMASARLGGLKSKRVLVLGAGDMGEGMVMSLTDAGVSGVLVANRTRSRAEALADRIGGHAVPLFDLPDKLVDVDLLFTSTGATALLLDHVDFAPIIEARNGRPLLIVDIAVPRDVDSAVGDLPGVELLDMDDLRHFAQIGMDRRRGEISAVEQIVEEELVRHAARSSARQVTPVVAAMHERAEQVRVDELERFAGKLEGLTAKQHEAVDALTRGILGKMLHAPTMTLKEQAGSARGNRLAEALRDLYDIDSDE